ncbi:MAG: YggS family pyridoxal phosphate enzyme, partial [Treponema sp. GWA1_62_8]
RLDAACARSGRRRDEVALMAVTKFQDRDAVLEAYGAGARLFGESRVQEAAAKYEDLLPALPGAELHMIGSLQANKAKAAAGLFSCIQSVDRPEIIGELAKRAAAFGKRLDLLLELHTGEDSKAGFPDLDSLLRGAEFALSFTASLRLRGLMTMAPYTVDQAPVRASFRALAAARNRLSEHFPEADFSVLSMGMTNDFEIAVEEGSTLVRIGTAIFAEGSR